jgi:hypothetical protein
LVTVEMFCRAGRADTHDSPRHRVNSRGIVGLHMAAFVERLTGPAIFVELLTAIGTNDAVNPSHALIVGNRLLT